MWKNIGKIGVYCFMSVLFPSCLSMAPTKYANHEWTVSRDGHIVSTDSVYKFSVNGDSYFYPDSLIISGAEAVASYDGLDEFIKGIREDIPFEVDSLLFFHPVGSTIFFTYSDSDNLLKPGSVTSGIESVEKFQTMWVRDDDVEDWNRRDSEIYTNVIVNRGQKRVMVVDRYTHKGVKVAKVTFMQTSSSRLERMGLPRLAFIWADVNDHSKLEVVSHFVELRRPITIYNYLLAQ